MSFKKITILSLVAAGAFATVATTTAAPTQAAKKTTITAITDGNVAPFAVKEKSGKLDGYDVDVLKAVVKKLPQYKLKWKIAEYDALLGNIDSGRADVGVNHFGKTAERQEKYLPGLFTSVLGT
ncbi:transporter substrate-binding domain-containing protein [Lacticaseibacillus sp. N501-2]|uniref:transporter substrate-binding domain-containing protein n=1 Tax=Lacticaseibacillus salsurae TaxID=3367729 RepID=UPI0038B3AB6F